jgi:hypothetical protein
MKNRCKMRKKQHLFFFWIGMMELLLSLRKISGYGTNTIP